MKANMKINVPDKLYIYSEAIFKALQKRRKDSDIEYIRTDAFIKKALNWMISQGGVNDVLSKEMIEDFKKCMEE